MSRRGVGIVSLLLLTAVSPIVCASVGWDNPLAVYITYPAGEYDIGVDVPVTVHVLKEGVRYDPDTLTLMVSVGGREVPLTKGSVGTYTGTFTIEEGDIDSGSLTMFVTAEDGLVIKDVAMGWANIYFATSDRFQADIETADDAPMTYSPGDNVPVTVTFTYDGTPVDPDDGTMAATLTGPGGSEGPLDLVRASTGVYEGSFEVPADLTESVLYAVSIEAEHTPAGITYSANIMMEFPVDFLILWLHYVEVTLDRTVLEIYVMDLTSAAIEGATVVVNHTYYDESWEEVVKHSTATTDEDGRVGLTLDHADVDPTDAALTIDGYAEKDGLRQLFEAYLSLSPDGGGIDPTDPLAVELLDGEPLAPATAMDLHLRAYSLGEPLATEDIIIYIASPHAMHYEGVLATGADGRFTVPVTTPAVGETEWGVLLECDFQVHALTEWVSTSDYYSVMEVTGMGELDIYMDPETTIAVEPFRLGGTMDVALDNPVADGVDEEAVFMWTIGDPTEWEDALHSEWSTLNGGGFGFWGFLSTIEGVWSAGEFHATFVVPEFLPGDITVFVMGLILFGDPMDEDIRGAYVKDLVPLPANPAPHAVITAPVAGEQYSGILTAAGTASDDTAVEGIDVRIDGGAWTAVSGTGTWSYTIDTTQLSSGTHMLEVRAYDGDKHSPIAKVVFEVDQPPTVAITSPAPDARVNKTLSVTGTASDDNTVDRVELRVDTGTWDPATGTTAWTAEVNLAGLASGAHTLEVRSSDGERTSVVAQLPFVVDTRPAVTISAPASASTLKEGFEFQGAAADDVAVTKVEARLDGGAWTVITGTTSWSWQVATKGLAEGDHTLDVRAWDGYAYSEVASVTFKYKKAEDSPGPTAALALLAIAGALGAVHLTMRRERR